MKNIDGRVDLKEARVFMNDMIDDDDDDDDDDDNDDDNDDVDDGNGL